MSSGNEYLQDFTNTPEVESEKQLLEIQGREASYTKLVQNYEVYNEKTLNSKTKYKKIAFWISFGLLILLTVFIIVMSFVLIKRGSSSRDVVDLFVTIIPSVTATIAGYFTLPKIIASYLFNTSEENAMVELIKHLRKTDSLHFKRKNYK